MFSVFFHPFFAASEILSTSRDSCSRFSKSTLNVIVTVKSSGCLKKGFGLLEYFLFFFYLKVIVTVKSSGCLKKGFGLHEYFIFFFFILK